VVGNRQFRNASVKRGNRVDIDDDVAVRREAGVQVRIQGQIAWLPIVHPMPSGALLTR
jgi:hypothetical protein